MNLANWTETGIPQTVQGTLALLLLALLSGTATGCSTQLGPRVEDPPPPVQDPPPLMTFVSPLPGLTYTVADDASDEPGLQLAVRVRVQDLARGLELPHLMIAAGADEPVKVAVTDGWGGRYAEGIVTVSDGAAARDVTLTAFARVRDDEGTLTDLVEPAQVVLRAALLPEPEECPESIVVPGDLHVQGPADLIATDECLTVTGDLRIEATALADLSGLDGLVEVGGDLIIVANSSLVDLDQLSRLRAVGGDLIIVQNPALPTTDAHELLARVGLEHIGGQVHISGNAPMAD